MEQCQLGAVCAFGPCVRMAFSSLDSHPTPARPPPPALGGTFLRKVEPGEVKILSLSAELGLNLASPGVLGCQQNFFNIYFIHLFVWLCPVLVVARGI